MEEQCKVCEAIIESGKLCNDCRAIKFCSNCGNKFEEDEVFCGKCGTKRGEEAAPAQTAPAQATPVSTESIGDKLKKVPKIVWAIAAVVIIIVIFMNMNGHKTPEKTAENFLVALEKQDAKRLGQYVIPEHRSAAEINEVLAYMPKDLKIKIVKVHPAEYDEFKYADVEVDVVVSSKSEDESMEDTMYIELELIDEKWYVADFW